MFGFSSFESRVEKRSFFFFFKQLLNEHVWLWNSEKTESDRKSFRNIPPFIIVNSVYIPLKEDTQYL